MAHRRRGAPSAERSSRTSRTPHRTVVHRETRRRRRRDRDLTTAHRTRKNYVRVKKKRQLYDYKK